MSHEPADILFAGQTLRLLPSGAIYHADSQTLWVADVHLGKAATYRRLGQPVPKGTTTENLRRLTCDLARHEVKHLVVLGDFLHGPQVQQAASTLMAIKAWRQEHARCQITLIRGNHDHRAGDPPKEFEITVVDQPHITAGLAGWHDIESSHPSKGQGILFGHTHPVFVLRGGAREQLRLPCFVVSANTLNLPAYGAFTGGHQHHPRAGETIYVLADQAVIRLPTPPST